MIRKLTDSSEVSLAVSSTSAIQSSLLPEPCHFFFQVDHVCQINVTLTHAYTFLKMQTLDLLISSLQFLLHGLKLLLASF